MVQLESSPKKYAIIDVETTGGTVGNSRITEIAIFITDGFSVLDEFSSLINPNQQIPAFITELTGITNDMVATAPTFKEVAQQILDITAGCTFVAHNVNFDYGIIRGEFSRLGYLYKRPLLCTVRLARQFIPGHRSYGLGKITADLGITISGRHRARGDAEATVELFKMIYTAADGDLHRRFDQKFLNSLPVGITRDELMSVPEGPGIFKFYDEHGEIIFADKARSLLKQILRYLREPKSPKLKTINTEIYSMSYEATGSELIASIKLAEVVRKHPPKHNNIQKRNNAWSIVPTQDLFGFLNLQVVKGRGANPVSFASKAEAETHLSKLIELFDLCSKLCGISDKTLLINCISGSCACGKGDSAEAYNDRVTQALSHSGFKNSTFAIIEENKTEDELAFVLIEDAQYAGYGTFDLSVGSMDSIYDLKNYLVAEGSHPENIRIVQQYLSRNNPRLITA